MSDYFRLWAVRCFLTYDSPHLRSAARSPVSLAICTRQQIHTPSNP